MSLPFDILVLLAEWLDVKSLVLFSIVRLLGDSSWSSFSQRLTSYVSRVLERHTRLSIRQDYYGPAFCSSMRRKHILYLALSPWLLCQYLKFGNA